MEGEQPQLGDLLTMVINHLLNGMILQVPLGVSCFQPDSEKLWLLAAGSQARLLVKCEAPAKLKGVKSFSGIPN